MTIKIIADGYYTTFEEADSWEETRDRAWGALHRVTLKRDRPDNEVEGVCHE